MLFNNNEKCPVCGKSFCEDDDVVICPVCGTPHHRECYNSLGHCCNADKHSQGFSYEKPDASHDNETAPAGKFSSDAEPKPGKKICPKCKKEINENIPYCPFCGEEQDTPSFFSGGNSSNLSQFGINENEYAEYKNDTRTIDDESVYEVAVAVRSNTSRFIPKFIKNKKLSWNWGAFIFGPYYMFFRKMNMPGAIMLAVSLASNLILNGFYIKPISALMTFVNSNMDAIYSSPTQELINQMMKLTQPLMPMFYIMFAISLVIHLISGLFADSIYRKTILTTVKKVGEKLNDGGVFSSNVTLPDDMQLSQDDMKVIYLARLGGTSIFAPILAYCVIGIIQSLISRL